MRGIDWEEVRYEAGNAGLIALMTVMGLGAIFCFGLFFGVIK